MSDLKGVQNYKDIARRKQADRNALIPSAWRLKVLPPPSQTNLLDMPRNCGILSAREVEITENHDATSLLLHLHNGDFTALEVTTAFCKRAAIAQQLTNCLTEIYFDAALARAKTLDAYFTQHKRPSGPLHGLPISIKDSFRIAASDASIGLAALCYKPAPHNSTLVDVLLRAGAVLYVKTNVPQTLMALDSHNNVFGRTLNPANTTHTAGGSSGGEGALVALRGSVLGIGTDVGGSIRVPAMCNGLVGVKPSHGRVPYAGQESGALEGQDALGVRASAGPIATSVRDCELFLRVVADMQAWRWDPEVVAQSWEGQVTVPRTRRLRVGVVRGDGVTVPHPPVARLMDEVVRCLRGSETVQTVEMNIAPLLGQCQSLFNRISGIDGNHMFDLLEASAEPLSPWLQGKIARRTAMPLQQLRDLHAQKARLQRDFLDIWRRDGGFWRTGADEGEDLDVLICPVAPHTTPPIDAWNTASYTSSFVLLDFPAATLPVRPLRMEDLHGEVEGSAGGSWDKANREMWAQTEKAAWLGSTLCLQIVGRRREDRMVVEAMGVLEEALGGLRREGGRGVAKL